MLGRRTVRRQSPGELTSRLLGRRVHRRGQARQVPAAVARRRRGAGRPPAHERSAAASRGGPSARRSPRTPTSWSSSRTARSCVSSIRGPSGNGSSPPTSMAAAFRPSSRISGATRSWRACPPPTSASKFAGRRAPLKALLTDQRIVAGIGSIYADEICFRARLRPDRAGGSLDARRRSPPWRRSARGVLRARGQVARLVASRPALPRPRRWPRVLSGPSRRLRPGGRALSALWTHASCGSRSAPGPPTAAKAASFEGLVAQAHRRDPR